MANYTQNNSLSLKDVVYSDLDIDFKVHPITGKLKVLKNAEAVKRALKNLILTKKFERPYEPLFGTNVVYSLFENFDAFTASFLKKEIQTSIENFEPRAILSDVNIRADEDNNALVINIIFFIRNQNEPVELTITTERIR